jgi:hypothetical protein
MHSIAPSTSANKPLDPVDLARELRHMADRLAGIAEDLLISGGQQPLPLTDASSNDRHVISVDEALRVIDAIARAKPPLLNEKAQGLLNTIRNRATTFPRVHLSTAQHKWLCDLARNASYMAVIGDDDAVALKKWLQEQMEVAQ